MATLFEAYVTNAGKYSEGQLVGETLKFPTTAQEVEALLKRIGVDGVRYQEIFITSFDGDVLGLYDHLSEYENLDELNHLACLLSELTSSELETLEAVLDSGDHCSSVRDIINLTQNLDCYGFYPGVSDEETLGRIYVDDLEMLDVPDQVNRISIMRRMAGMPASTKTAILPRAAMLSKKAIISWKCITACRIFPRNIRCSLSRSSRSGSRWRLIRKS